LLPDCRCFFDRVHTLIGYDEIGFLDEGAVVFEPQFGIDLDTPMIHVSIDPWEINTPEFNRTKDQVFIPGANATTNCTISIGFTKWFTDGF
jgi:hypothetical protein